MISPHISNILNDIHVLGPDKIANWTIQLLKFIDPFKNEHIRIHIHIRI